MAAARPEPYGRAMASVIPKVVVVGGGIAALEAIMALRDLAGDRVDITLVAADTDFVLRPLLAAEGARRHPLRDIAADFGVRFARGRVIAIDPAARRVAISGGDSCAYDTLILAPGARTLPAFDGAITVGDADGQRAVLEMLDAIDVGTVGSVACIVTARPGWPLPAYEAALASARRMPRAQEPRVFVITPEAHPLEVFGDASSAAVAGVLGAAGVEFIGSQLSDVVDGKLRLPGHAPGELAVDRIVATPLVRGPRIAGVPEAGIYGLIPVDDHGRVTGLHGVYAAGDATTHPVKHGSLAAQQALAAAEHVAARHGAHLTPTPYRPVVRGLLLNADSDPILLGAGTEGWEPTKLPGRYLGPYLSAHGFSATGRGRALLA